VLAACPSPNTYATARTLPPNSVQVVTAAEAYGGVGQKTDPMTNEKRMDIGAMPTLPTFGARFGIMDNFDLGLRLPNLASVAGDAKVMLMSGTFDLAIDPGVQWYRGSADISYQDRATEHDAINIIYSSLPLMIDYNVSKHLTLTASPGATLYF